MSLIEKRLRRRDHPYCRMNTIAMRCTCRCFEAHSIAPTHHFRYRSSLIFSNLSTFVLAADGK
nr:hypothetical protein [Bradyrhizobium sp. CCBAU 51753]